MGESVGRLHVHDWSEWQTYRSDRGQPPWIKVHRCVMRNPKWVALSDAAKGQLLSIWLLAADDDGWIPADPKLVQKLCYMDATPDLQAFVRQGFLDPDDNTTTTRRHGDVEVTDQSALARGRGREEAEAEAEPTHTAREDGDLMDWLGDHAPMVDDLDLVGDPRTRTGLYQQFGPPGLRANAWKMPDGSSVRPENRPAMLAEALTAYAMEGKESIVTREFAGLLKGLIVDSQEEANPSGSSQFADSAMVVTDEEIERLYGR